MRDRREAHFLRGVGGQGRAQATGAEEDKTLVLLKLRLGVGTGRVDPEFEHAARTMESAGNAPVALKFARIAQIDEQYVLAPQQVLRLGNAQCRDLRIGFGQHVFDAIGDFRGHGSLLWRDWSACPARRQSSPAAPALDSVALDSVALDLAPSIAEKAG